MSEPNEKVSVFKKFPGAFWSANLMELFERMAYYGMFAVLSLYLTSSVSEGALGFTDAQRGSMQGIFMLLVYLIPVFAGAIGDRYGYKKTFIVAFLVYAAGFFLISTVKTYYAVFAMFVIVAVGAGMFKPLVAGTIARTTDKKTSSVGFAIYYMVVNIGGFFGPIIAGILRKTISWDWVFYASAIYCLLMLIPTLFFYKEPTTEADSKKARSFKKVIADAFLVLTNFKYILFLLIFSGFWIVFMQLFITTPLIIRDYTNTTPLLAAMASFFGFLGIGGLQNIFNEMVSRGTQINPEYLINLNCFIIIFLVVAVSKVIERLKPMSTFLWGLSISAVSSVVFFWAQNPWILLLGILVFTFGEMIASPNFTRYCGKIAPKDQVALFIGYSFFSAAIGFFIAGFLSGHLYAVFGPNGSNKPYMIWAVFAGIQVVTVILLYVYDKFIAKSPEFADNPAAEEAK